ncbi:MGMT family protein [Pseudarthrobacter sp. NPDC058362]|uniref:MGMT family protein n=1 Tax=Pseudarthrobacter sp. NPDC058362 TaxID=3346458 RepID=UPI00365DC0DC
MRSDYVEAVLAVVDMVPAGSAVSYGDVAELLGAGGPRQVGAVMSHHGSTVPWWRVLRADGRAPAGHEAGALRHYLEEETALRGDIVGYLRTGEGSWRVDLAAARWAPTEENFARIDALACGLAAPLPELSLADDGMSG